MQKLYDSSGHIKVDLIEKALKRAKYEGKLPNVSSFKIEKFMKSLEEEIEESMSRVGHQINKHEMEFLFKELTRRHHDNVTKEELEVIEGILLDDHFEI